MTVLASGVVNQSQPGRSDILAARLRLVAGQARANLAERDRLVVERRRQGATLRQIGAEAGVNHQTVVRILRAADVR